MPVLHEAWQPKKTARKSRRLNTRTTRRGGFEAGLVIEMATGTCHVSHAEKTWCRYIIVRPNSHVRLAWDMLTLVAVGYDVVTIPLLAFEMEDNPITYVVDWGCLLFWSIDLPVSFITGYHTEGVVEMRASAIAKKYLSTWFFLDACIVIVDWLFMMMLVSNNRDALGMLRYGKTGRVSRLLRAFRLLRFIKLQRTLTEFIELIKSDYMSTLVNVGMTILFIVTLNHYLACGWYFVGNWNSNAGNPNWVDENKLYSEPYIYRYTTSLHWSLTQFTPASMEIRPFNLGERTYSIVVLLFALITFSSFLGSITTAMTQLRNLRSAQAKQQALLRRYFADNHISTELGQRIWKFIKSAHFGHRVRTRTVDVDILRLMPTTLRKCLNEELYRPYTTRVPILHHYLQMENDGHAEVCQKAISEQSLIAGDETFNVGQEGLTMYIVVSGLVTYKVATAMAEVETVSLGKWVSEHSVWFKWVHGGQMVASTSCELFNMNAEVCRRVMAKYANAMPYLQAYARHFAEAVLKVGDSNWGTDLWCDTSELEDLIQVAFDEIHEELGPVEGGCVERNSSIKEEGFFHLFSNFKRATQDLGAHMGEAFGERVSNQPVPLVGTGWGRWSRSPAPSVDKSQRGSAMSAVGEQIDDSRISSWSDQSD